MARMLLDAGVDPNGRTGDITLLFDLGFPVDARGDDGGTPLHAAYSGSAPAVRLLLDRGTGVEARDTTWDSTPVEWAAIGSGEQRASHPHPRLDRHCASPARRGRLSSGHHPVSR